MRTTLFTCAATLVVLAALAPSPASAGLILYDGFDYTAPGALTGNTNVDYSQNWHLSPTGTGAPTVTSGSLSYPGLPASTGNSVLHNRLQSGLARINIPGQPYTGTLYFSLIVRLNDIIPGQTSALGSFLAGFNNGTGTDSTGLALDQVGQLYIRKDPNNQATRVQFGAAKNNGGTSTRVWGTPSFAPGDTVFAVVAYTFGPGAGDDSVSFWLNPVPGTNPAATATTSVGDDVGSNAAFSERTANQDIRSFYVRNNSVQSGNLQVDELRIGTTFASVTPIPEPASIALAALAGAAALVARRRKG